MANSQGSQENLGVDYVIVFKISDTGTYSVLSAKYT